MYILRKFTVTHQEANVKFYIREKRIKRRQGAAGADNFAAAGADRFLTDRLRILAICVSYVLPRST